MTEELPKRDADPGAADANGFADGEIGSQPGKRHMSVTWMILLSLLVVAAAMFASDVFRGRKPQQAAFEKVNSKLVPVAPDDPDDPGGGFGGRRGGNQPQPLTAEAVHELLGRKPDFVENRSGNLTGKDESDVQMEPVVVETYKFPGIIKAYDVVVTYAVIPAVDKKPASTALKYVRKE
jgi:hypothetical protein